MWGIVVCVGLIGEETEGSFKTYHFDYRGSTVAITDVNGNITDRFEYDTYGKMTGRTGTSDIIFLYNGRDGVVTDTNGLIYMRARYYSPELRRFINADILAGDIANGITLNRYAYANGNPVSLIDPRGLSAERAGISYNQAVLVTRFLEEGLPIVGHTQLYFLGNDGVWHLAEFTSYEGDNIKEIKGNAKVYWEQKNPPMGTTIENFKDVEGVNYVVLSGNFNDSVELAQQYASDKDFGRYNFLFHNCADYTNALLDVADLNGMANQVLSEGNALIEIPVLREFALSISSTIDSTTNAISNGAVELGTYIKDSNIPLADIAGDLLVSTGNFINSATNFVGDVVDVVNRVTGKITDTVKHQAAAATNTIIDVGVQIANSISYAWNKLFG